MLHGRIKAALRADAYESDTWICSSPRQARGRAHIALLFTMLCIRTAAFWVGNLSSYVSTQERHFKLTLINFLQCQQWPRSLCTSDAHKFLSMSSLNAFFVWLKGHYSVPSTDHGLFVLLQQDPCQCSMRTTQHSASATSFVTVFVLFRSAFIAYVRLCVGKFVMLLCIQTSCVGEFASPPFF